MQVEYFSFEFNLFKILVEQYSAYTTAYVFTMIILILGKYDDLFKNWSNGGDVQGDSILLQATVYTHTHTHTHTHTPHTHHPQTHHHTHTHTHTQVTIKHFVA